MPKAFRPIPSITDRFSKWGMEKREHDALWRAGSESDVVGSWPRLHGVADL